MCIQQQALADYHWAYVSHCKKILYPKVLVLEQMALSQNGGIRMMNQGVWDPLGGQVGDGPILLQNTAAAR